MEKERVDILVVQQGLTDSREKAKRLVMAGQIVDAVNHNRYDKPGEKIPVTSSLMIKGEPLKYVSRGGLKLEKALKEFDVSVDGKILLEMVLRLVGLQMRLYKMGPNKVMRSMWGITN